MSKKNSKKPAPAPKKAPSGSNGKTKPAMNSPAKRKIGSRTETIVERLSITQVEAERAKVCDLYRERASVIDKKKAATSGFNSQIAELDSKIHSALNAASTGRREVEITIEEWLTDQNQIQRYRVDTGELIGDRTASPAELQESLPFDEPDEEDDTGEDANVEEAVASAVEAEDDEFGEATA